MVNLTLKESKSTHELLHQYIERFSITCPDQEAVCDLTQSLTYDALNKRANQLAHLLQDQYQVTVGDIVALQLSEKNVFGIALILAILKCGAAYLPLNATLTDANLTSVLAQAQAKCLLTETPQDYVDYPSDNPTLQAKPNFAYLIYTSGSTGNPKLVAVSHRNVIETFASWDTVYALSPADRHLQMANLFFDVFTGDWVRALCSGATLVLYPTTLLHDAKHLYQVIQKQHITIAEFVPAVLNQLVDYMQQHKLTFEFFRLIISGSDTWYFDAYYALQAVCSKHIRVINSYGATEATIDSAYLELTSEIAAKLSTQTALIPIGRPFPHVTLKIIDEEIYIGGTGVADGEYFNCPELSAEKFITLDGERVYRTGDQGRYLDDIVLFSGRNNQYIKFQGKRFSLADIENNMRSHPAVKDCVVIRKRMGQSDQLVGYLQLTQVLQFDTLYDYLSQRLPNAVIPQQFYRVDSLKLTENGKYNRQDQLGDIMGEISPEFVKPQSDTEKQIWRIWSEVLQHERFGIEHPFVYAGGNSLSCVKMLDRVSNSFKITLTTKMGYLTVKTLAQSVETTRKGLLHTN